MTDDVHGLDVRTGAALHVRLARTILSVEPEAPSPGVIPR